MSIEMKDYIAALPGFGGLTLVNSPILVKLTHEKAKLPAQEQGNVGFDICSVEGYELQPGKVTRISTGVTLADSPEPLLVDRKMVAVPFLKIEGRSGLASRGIFPVGGIVDPNYRGEIGVMLFNSTDQVYVINEGDRVAQLVCYYTLSNASTTVVKFLATETVTETTRGDKGFGSSGR